MHNPARSLLCCVCALLLPVAHACVTDLDCSLTGQCNSGACHCDAAWEGEQCERLAFVPAGNETDVNSPWALHDLQVSTWGMGTAQRALGDGAQHMWGTELTGGCGITSWQSNSQVVHWTSATPLTGPWNRTHVALPPETTCPSAAVAPDGTLVMTVGVPGRRGTSKQKIPANYPDGDPVTHQFCRNGSTPCGFSKHGCFGAAGHNREPALSSVSTLRLDAAQGKTTMNFSMYASRGGVSGPWVSVSPRVELALNFTGEWAIAAPWISPDGTTHIVLQTGEWPDFYPVALRQGNIGTVIEAASWEGPYTVIARGACGPGEDMYMVRSLC